MAQKYIPLSAPIKGEGVGTGFYMDEQDGQDFWVFFETGLPRPWTGSG